MKEKKWKKSEEKIIIKNGINGKCYDSNIFTKNKKKENHQK